jgi:NAD(P)-dependent dehydrogenase (short-subunit alcohol dehydrogenase family)
MGSRRKIIMNDLFSVKGKKIVITGTAGILGHEYATYFAGQGAKVYGWDIKPGVMIPGKVFWQEVDIRDSGAVKGALEEISQIDAMVCNAAIDFPPAAIVPNNDRKQDALDVNIIGTERCIFEGARKMIASGSVVVIGSVYGMVSPDQKIYPKGFFKPSIYSITKSALYGMTKYWAATLAKEDIRVNILTLGGVDSGQDREFVKRYVVKVPMGRMALPKDYFGALQFLVSDASRYMTGANLVIDGGYTAL